MFVTVLASTMIDFLIESAARTDSGVYRIKAVNQTGECERDVNVLVVGMLYSYSWYAVFL